MNILFNKFAILTFGLFTFLLFDSAASAQSKNEILIVADRRADCTGAAPMKCLQTKRPQDEKWSLFYQTIENFNYVEGFTYVLRVKVETIKNPPADASSLKYTLKKVISREKTGSENTSDDSSELTSGDWRLIAIDNSKVNTDKAFINFNLNKTSVGGNGGCNGFGGTLSKNGGTIRISEVISTQMFCEDTSEIENKFLRNLERVTKYQITGGKLLLYAADKVILEFAPKK